MIPVSVIAMAPLADSVLQTFNRISDAREAQEAQSPFFTQSISGVAPGGIEGDFKSLFNRAAALDQATRGRGVNGVDLQTQMGEELGRLNEVQGLLAASAPGAVIKLALASNGELSQTLPGGGRQPILLSSDSRSSVNRMLNLASASNVANFTGNQEFALRAKV